MNEIENLRYPHYVKIVRITPGRVDDNNPFADDDAPLENIEEVLYEGEGRSFTDTTTEGGKNVNENKRKSSIPIRFNEWDEDKQPQDGDVIKTVVGNNSTIGIVNDCEPDNNRSIIYWTLRRV